MRNGTNHHQTPIRSSALPVAPCPIHTVDTASMGELAPGCGTPTALHPGMQAPCPEVATPIHLRLALPGSGIRTVGAAIVGELAPGCGTPTASHPDPQAPCPEVTTPIHLGHALPGSGIQTVSAASMGELAPGCGTPTALHPGMQAPCPEGATPVHFGLALPGAGIQTVGSALPAGFAELMPAGTTATAMEPPRLSAAVRSGVSGQNARPLGSAAPVAPTRRHFLHLAAAIPAFGATEPGFRFALIGDRTGTAAPQIYSRTWRDVSLFGPDLAVSIGDTIEGGKDSTAAKEWREMDDVWRRYRRVPTYYVPGNHDIWSPESKRLFEAEAGHPATHAFVHSGALFVILDNSLTDALPPGQLEYCERILAGHRDLRPKFVFCHRPSWLLDAVVGNRNFGLHTLARKYAVDYVISGHGHQLVHVELDGVRYLEIGSSGGSIARGLRIGQGFKEGWFYHWIWAQVRNGKVDMTVKEVTPPGRVFRLSDWGPSGAKFDPADPALLDRPSL